MVHTPVWSDDTTARLWDYYSSLQDDYVPYFTRLLGDGLLNFASTCGILRGRILDYGSGPGHLTKKLVDRGQIVAAVDFSARSCDKLSEILKASEGFQGVHHVECLPSPLSSDSFDLIFCSEVVEHLSDKWLSPTMAELFRLTKPGGYVLISTPCSEVLKQSFVYCPFCDSEFHRWQHLRSFSPESLKAVMSDVGFRVLLSKGINLSRFQDLPSLYPLRRLSLARLADWVLFEKNQCCDKVSRRTTFNSRVFRYLLSPGPHLVCVAAKPTI